MAWTDPATRYVVRRIRERDKDQPFVTSFHDFDAYEDPADYGTLRDYWKRDQGSTRPMPAYVLIDCSSVADDESGPVVGVMRYRYEGESPAADELTPGEGPYLYFSRVGICTARQRSRLGRLLVEFFFHLVISEMQRVRLSRLVVWWKCIDRSLTLIRPLTDTDEVDIFATKWSDRWGREYYVKLDIGIDWL